MSCAELNLEDIRWIIVGGELGPGARPIEVSWVIDIRNQCRVAGVPFFFTERCMHNFMVEG
jgi:protein gp37